MLQLDPSPAQQLPAEPLTTGQASATTMLAIEDSRQRVWLLLEQPVKPEVGGSTWQFPTGPLVLNEQPLLGAKRTLETLAAITELGRPVPLARRAHYRMAGAVPAAEGLNLPPLAIQTIEGVKFAHYATLTVWSIEDVLAVNRQHAQGSVKLATSQEVGGLIEQKSLCPTSQQHWSALRQVFGFQL